MIKPMLLVIISYNLHYAIARTPNQKLLECCHADNTMIDKTCAQKYCQIQMIRRESVFPLIAECGSKGNTVGNIWNCVSSRADHRPCCRQLNVSEKCMAFCNAKKDAPKDIFQYGPCLMYFNVFKQCFTRYLRRHPAYRG